MELDIDTYFGSAMKFHRKKLRLSQEQLADRADMDRTFISMLERGLRKPSLESAFIIAKALDIDVVILIKEMQTQFERGRGNF